MFNCNELPKEVEQTHAFFRRFIIIPFDQTIPEAEQDPELAQKIIAGELSGVFNWVFDGLRRLLVQKKFTQSAMVQDQVKTYRKESDSVAMFIDEEGYKPTNDYPNLFLKSFYDSYKMYCFDNENKACSSKTLSERLRVLSFGVEKRRDGRMVHAEK